MSLEHPLLLCFISIAFFASREAIEGSDGSARAFLEDVYRGLYAGCLEGVVLFLLGDFLFETERLLVIGFCLVAGHSYIIWRSCVLLVIYYGYAVKFCSYAFVES
jgi:hypothetical protein